MTTLARLAFVPLLLSLGCDSSGEPEARYLARVDLGATVAQLAAEEQADVDEAVERLAALGDAAVPALEAAIASEPQPVRLGAVEALGQMTSARATAALARTATTPGDPEVRATALLKLGESGDAAGRPALEAALTDASDMVSQTAAVACGALCTSPDAIERIVEMGLHRIPEVELGRLRGTLVRILAGQDEAAAAHARKTMRDRTAPVLAGEAPIEARVRAALLAADAGATDVEPVLVAAATECPSRGLRLEAIQWLGRSGSAAAVPVLKAALEDRTTAAGAAMALRALAVRGVPEARDAIANPTRPASPPRPAEG